MRQRKSENDSLCIVASSLAELKPDPNPKIEQNSIQPKDLI